ncbi:hypothetical protein Tco_0790554 [Tanacetum coccineum]
MAFSDSEVHNDKPCTKSCLKNYETLKKQYDDLLAKLHESIFKASTYKRGLDTVEAQLVTYRKNEVLFSEEVVVLKREVGIKQYEINTVKTQFEKLKQEKDAFDFKIKKFDKASKDLDQLLESQITDKSKKGLGYSAVPPPHPLIYNRPNKLDLSYSGLEEFQQPEFEVSDNEDEVESPVVVEKKTVVPTIPKVDVVRPKQQEKSVRKTVRYAEMYRSQKPRGNQRNWNNQKSQQLGNDFVMHNKACYICGSFDHLQYTCKHKRHVNGQREEKPVWKNTRRVNDHYSTRMTHSNPRRNMIPQAVLMRSGIKVVNTAKPKDAYNTVKRNRFNTVKALACWMPKNRVIDHGRNNAQIDEDHFGLDGCTDLGEAGVQQRQKIMMKGKGFPEQKVNHKFRGGLLGIKLSALSTAKSKITVTGDDSAVPTTNEKITLAQTFIQIKAAKPKVVTTTATTATTTRPKDRRVVVQELSEFRVPQEIKPSSSKDKGKDIMIETEVTLKRKDQIALDEQIARDAQAKEIAALKKRIQRELSPLSEDQESLGVPEDASKQGRSIADIDADVEVTLVDETQVRSTKTNDNTDDSLAERLQSESFKLLFV